MVWKPVVFLFHSNHHCLPLKHERWLCINRCYKTCNHKALTNSRYISNTVILRNSKHNTMKIVLEYIELKQFSLTLLSRSIIYNTTIKNLWTDRKSKFFQLHKYISRLTSYLCMLGLIWGKRRLRTNWKEEDKQIWRNKNNNNNRKRSNIQTYNKLLWQ